MSRARLARYSLWQFRDFAIERGIAIMIIGLLWGYTFIAPLRAAMGAAFASKYKNDGTVAVCFCGDGATNEGAWHEAMNFAGLYKLPLITVIENNHWGEFTRQEKQAPITELYLRAASYGMPGVRVDGMNVVSVFEATKEALDRARSGGGPTMIECDTYRFHNHMGVIDADPRPQEERDRWHAKDPLDLMRRVLEDRRLLSGEGADRIVEEVRREIEDAVQFAENSPFPDPATDLLTDVFTV